MAEAPPRPRIAVVVQRYGAEIGGGSEVHARVVAERLAPHYDVEVLTTCALDYTTWKNHYPPGLTAVNGITVRRFSVAEKRSPRFMEKFERIFWHAHSDEDERELLRMQGPYSPAMLEHLARTRDEFDLFFFFTYLYHPTCFGLPLIGRKAVLQPTAHDEEMIYLRHFDTVFHSTPHLVFGSEEEKRFTARRFCLPSHAGRVSGVGIGEEANLAPDASWDAFRKRVENTRLVTYVGRIDRGKGCQTLVDHFLRYLHDTKRADVRLLLIGTKAMEIPAHPAILAPGYVTAHFKREALRASTVSIAPSSLESLCMAALEAWSEGCPVLASGHSQVLVGHCLRSNGGLWFRDYAEFRLALDRFLSNEEFARVLGEQGRTYVKANYTWPQVERVYREVLDEAIADNRGRSQVSRRLGDG